MRFPERTAFALFLLPGISVFAQTLTPATTISAPSARFSASPKLSGTQGLLGVVAASGSTLSSNLVNAATGALSGAEVLDGPFSLVASDPAGRFVYVAAGTTLFGGTIDSGNGVLTPIPGFPYSLPGAITALTVEGSGRFLYVGWFGGAQGASIDPATGALTAIAGSPFGLSLAGAFVNDGAGKYLYALVAGNYLSVQSIDATTGELTEIAGSPFGNGGTFRGLAMDPLKRFLFVYGASGIAGYAISGTTGGLTALDGSPFFAGAQTDGVSFDGSGRFLYASRGGLIWGFAVDAASGNLTAVPESPFLCGAACYALAGDASGKYLYAIDDNGVLAYQIDAATGALTYINGLYLGTTNISVGTSIAVVPAVGSPTATLQSIQILPSDPTVASISVGLNQQFSATGTYSDGSQRFLTGSVTWSSSNTGVATISNTLGQNGLATTTGVGSTTITATLQGVSATTTFTAQSIPLLSLAVTPSSPTIASGTALQVTATGTYSDGSTQNLTSQVGWSSSNAAAATVSAAGLLTAVAAGTANITATLGTVSGSVPVTVIAPQTAVRAPPRGIVAAPNSALGSYVVNAATGAVSQAQFINEPDVVSRVTAADPGGRFVYVSGVATGGYVLSGYSVDAVDGALTPVPGSPYSLPSQASAMAVEASGRFLYVGLVYVESPSFVQGYGIDPATGALTAIPGSPFAAGIREWAGGLVSDGAGKFLYAAGDGVAVWAIDAVTGALTPVIGSPFGIGSYGNGLAMDPQKRFLFVSGNGIAGYAIDGTTGALTSLAGSPFFAAAETYGVSLDGSGRFLYVSQSNTNKLWGFVIDATSGALTPVPGTPFLCGPGCGALGDGSGKYLYATSNTAVAEYGIDAATGALTYINGFGPAETSIAVVPAIGSPTATLQSLQITPPNPTVVSGSNQQFTATGTYSDGTQRFLTSSVTWSSSNSAVATISNTLGQNGLATGTGSGGTIITCHAAGSDRDDHVNRAVMATALNIATARASAIQSGDPRCKK